MSVALVCAVCGVDLEDCRHTRMVDGEVVSTCKAHCSICSCQPGDGAAFFDALLPSSERGRS